MGNGMLGNAIDPSPSLFQARCMAKKAATVVSSLRLDPSGHRPDTTTKPAKPSVILDIQVKQKDKVGRPDIDAFEAMMMREDCAKGFFVSFDYSDDAMREADAFFRRTGKSIILFTVQDILEAQLAQKLA